MVVPGGLGLGCAGVDHDEVTRYCFAKPGLSDEPWEEVGRQGRWQELHLPDGGRLGVTCATIAEEAAEWRQCYPHTIAVMLSIGRYGWNTAELDGTAPDEEIVELVDESYDDVVARLPKSERLQVG